MHIREFKVENITSYCKPTAFKFTPKLNIFIGPNGGGKTNAIQALWLPLQRFLFSQYQIQIDNPKEKKINPFDQIKNRYNQDLQPHNPNLPAKVEITIATDDTDAQNMTLIKGYSQELKSEFLPNHFTQFDEIPEEDIKKISEGVNLSFSFASGRFLEPSAESIEYSFLSYCRLINMVSQTRNKDLSAKFNNPIFFLQSLRQSSVGYSIGIAGVQRQSLNDNLNSIFSSGGTGISSLASQHFGLLMQRSVDEASKKSGAVAQALFDAEPDVKLFRQFLQLLGYEWNLVQHGHQFGNYISEYKKDGKAIEPTKFSSGEKEIINFLDGIISTKVNNGIVLIDEPELHLHPRWQSILLDLIKEFSEKRNLQFIFSTHSPVFVTHDTIDAVTRIFQKDACSTHASIHAATALPNKAHLVRMINSHNNERLFFADRVVLVEGIMDRLVFENLVRFIGDRFSRRKTTEVVEVHGKHNFLQYKRVLDIVKMPTSVIADQDYLLTIGTPEIKKLFVSDCEGIDRNILLNKKSRDATTLIEAIEEAANNKNFSDVEDIIAYIKNRRVRLKDEMTEQEKKKINDFIAARSHQGTYILKVGEIEDYLPEGITSPGKLINLLEDPNWLQRLDQQSRTELLNIIITILELSDEDIASLHTEFKYEKRHGTYS